MKSTYFLLAILAIVSNGACAMQGKPSLISTSSPTISRKDTGTKFTADVQNTRHVVTTQFALLNYVLDKFSSNNNSQTQLSLITKFADSK